MSRALAILVLLAVVYGPVAGATARGEAGRLWAQAQRQLADGKLEAAEKTCSQALAADPSPALRLKVAVGLATVCCKLDKAEAAAKAIAQAETLLEATKDAEAQARVLYLKAVLACEKDDMKSTMALLRRAVAASEKAMLWANDDDGFFINIRLLDEDSDVQKAFVKLIDLTRYDKALRADIDKACAQAKREKKRVLLTFHGEWCPWCRDMTRCLRTPEVTAALGSYVTLTIDIGRFSKHQVAMKQFVDRMEIPALVVLDADGKKIVHLACSDFEDRGAGRNDPERLAALLAKHAP